MTTDTARADGWRRAVAAIDEAIRSGQLDAAALAELRRLEPDDPASPAFWQTLIRYVEPYDAPPGDEGARRLWERRWAAILGGMARLSHDPATPAGHALAEAGFSELRLRRLLRSADARLTDELRAAVQFLAATGVPADWRQLAELVLADPGRFPDWAERVRRRVSREYFRRLYDLGRKEE
ncbi:MAG TPA: type I-E CRISPR-associated protein Cse2/CasB [Dehalococcoidia bacterium]